MRKTPAREDETSSSPFASIVLKEKKEEAPRRQPAVKPKKPGEIVQGYDPGASFKDILYNWEHTGNPRHIRKVGGQGAEEGRKGNVSSCQRALQAEEVL